jgi:hypothetical protein
MDDRGLSADKICFAIETSPGFQICKPLNGKKDLTWTMIL